MITYTKPQYQIKAQQKLQDLLRKFLRIPNENRRFEWTAGEWIIPVLECIYNQMRMREYYKMGQFIILEKNEEYIIYDAQHRVTTLILILLAIASIAPSRHDEIIDVISKSSTSLKLNERCSETEKAVCNANGWKRYPRLVSENENDFIALGNLMNSVRQTGSCKSAKSSQTHCCPVDTCGFNCAGKKEIKLHIKGHKVKDACVSKWKCNGCELIFDTKNAVDEHLNNDDYLDSNIYEAYKVIQKYLAKNPVDPDILYCYVLDVITFDMHITTSEDEARQAYSQNNTIGKTVSPYDLLKTWFIRNIPGKKAEIIRRFESLNSIDTKLPLDAQQIAYICICMLRKEWISIDSFKKGGYEKILDGKEPSEFIRVFDTFCNLSDKCIEILEFTRSNRIGRLVPYITSGVEITMMSIVPIGVVFGKEVLERYFKLLIAASIRIDCGKRLTFNPVAYQTVISDLLTRSLNGLSEMECYSHFVKLLMPKVSDQVAFHKKFSEHTFTKNLYIKAVLQFIVELTDTHETQLNSGSIDLEHAHAESRAETLEQPSHVYRIGNLTLFCAQNSEELRGNRSLKDLPFLEKIPHYEKSNIKMTRDLLKYKEGGFSDKEILERSNELTSTIYSLTARILG
jgi:hypothetical protein